MPIILTHQNQKVSVNPSPSQTVRSVLEEATRKLKLSGYFELQYNGKSPDLSLPFRLAGIPNMAKAELVRIEERGEILNIGIQTSTGRTVFKVPDSHTFRQVFQSLGIESQGLHVSVYGDEITDLDCSLRKLGLKSPFLVTILRRDGKDITLRQPSHEQGSLHIVPPPISESETEYSNFIQSVLRDPSRPPVTAPGNIKVILPTPIVDTSTDSDYEMTPAQFQTYHSLLSERQEGGPLLTKKHQEMNSKSQPSYLKIKVRFPDGISVVATFAGDSLVGFVYTWLRGIIKTDYSFIIYLTSPYTEIHESEQLLADVVPRGSVLFHFKPLSPFDISDGFLNDEYMSLARDASHIPAATDNDDKQVLPRTKDDKRDDKSKSIPKWLKFGKTK